MTIYEEKSFDKSDQTKNQNENFDRTSSKPIRFPILLVQGEAIYLNN